MKYYFPCKMDKPDKKYYIITKDNTRMYISTAGYVHFSSGHNNEERKQSYINRHKKNESNFWSKELILIHSGL